MIKFTSEQNEVLLYRLQFVKDYLEEGNKQFALSELSALMEELEKDNELIPF